MFSLYVCICRRACSDVTRVEWQVFRDTENTEELGKLSTKRKTQKIAESCVFATEKETKGIIQGILLFSSKICH